MTSRRPLWRQRSFIAHVLAMTFIVASRGRDARAGVLDTTGNRWNLLSPSQVQTRAGSNYYCPNLQQRILVVHHSRTSVSRRRRPCRVVEMYGRHASLMSAIKCRNRANYSARYVPDKQRDRVSRALVSAVCRLSFLSICLAGQLD